jgi:hypothetical protein
MANTDPVSGLMASMSRIRSTRPDGVAQQAGTAIQATTASQKGTALPPAPLTPTPTVSQPAVQPTSFTQVLPAAAPAQPGMPTAPAPQPTSDEYPEYLVANVASQVLLNEPDVTIGDAYLLGLGFLYGIPKSNPGLTQPGSTAL